MHERAAANVPHAAPMTASFTSSTMQRDKAKIPDGIEECASYRMSTI